MACLIVFNAVGGSDAKKLLISVPEEFDEVSAQLQNAGWANVSYGKQRCVVNAASVAFVQEQEQRGEPGYASW